MCKVRVTLAPMADISCPISPWSRSKPLVAFNAVGSTRYVTRVVNGRRFKVIATRIQMKTAEIRTT